MPSIQIADSAIRQWASNFGYAPGSRGPLPRRVVLDYAAYQEMDTQKRLARAEARISELEAQAGRDQKVIANLQAEIRQLRAELVEWKDRATILAGIVHSED